MTFRIVILVVEVTTADPSAQVPAETAGTAQRKSYELAPGCRHLNDPNKRDNIKRPIAACRTASRHGRGHPGDGHGPCRGIAMPVARRADQDDAFSLYLSGGRMQSPDGPNSPSRPASSWTVRTYSGCTSRSSRRRTDLGLAAFRRDPAQAITGLAPLMHGTHCFPPSAGTALELPTRILASRPLVILTG